VCGRPIWKPLVDKAITTDSRRPFKTKEMLLATEPSPRTNFSKREKGGHFAARGAVELYGSGQRSVRSLDRQETSMEATGSTRTATGTDVRPFTIEVSDEQLADLRRRINATKWPDVEINPAQGVQLATIQELARYWATEYDWRRFEERFAALPHFITEIDGVDIHFIHVRSGHEDALPLIVTHGWPGSTIEQLKIIGPLTEPTEFGASASDAFHLVIPSLPGYGFSGKPTETGWDPIRIARAWVELMNRLGYTEFVAQGGDWGNAVTEQMALLKPPGLLGIHTNMPATVPPDISRALQIGDPPPAGLSADEENAYGVLAHFFATGVGYAGEMANRPQTLYGIADSPVGLAAWMLDHDVRSYELIARAFAGNAGGLSRDVTHYWLTNTAVSSARLYWESKLAFFDVKGVEIPVGVTVFPDELYPAPRSWAERAYPKLIHFNEVEEGGHFAAWEQPLTFAEEMRATFRSLR
jgi:pimeloyl-ACP methyl ester carboxylesterase